MIIVGATEIEYPAALLPEKASEVAGVTLIEINTKSSIITPKVQIFLQYPCSVVLPHITRLLKLRNSSSL
jgi:NAD-dependent SIR2 family protein deacetylase